MYSATLLVRTYLLLVRCLECERTNLLLALVIWPLTTHPFRDGAPFLLLLETPPACGGSLHCFHIIHGNFLLIAGGGVYSMSYMAVVREGVFDSMHGRSRMTIDPRIPAMPGRSTPSFHRPGRHCLLAPGAKGGGGVVMFFSQLDRRFFGQKKKRKGPDMRLEMARKFGLLAWRWLGLGCALSM